ncbi:MAG: permease-like cell division protein FtsX [Myxococcota bacterium]
MRRVLVQLDYFVRTSLRGLRSSPVTSAAAVATIGVSLVLVGTFALLLWNMEGLLNRFGDALFVTAYLEDGLPVEDRKALVELVATVEGVERVRVVSQREALERFQASVGLGSALLEGLAENPLPASLEITLLAERRSSEGLRVVVESVDGLPGISELASGQDWVEGYLRAVALVRAVGMGLGLILALATVLIVANTIRLAVLARRDEIEILTLVGASRVFVATPFLIEGLVQGAAGGVAAVAVLLGLFRLVLPGFEFGLEFLLGGVAPRFFSVAEAAALVGGGAGLGLFGSAAALTGGWKE